MTKILIGTPAHDGRLDVWYTNSLINTVKMSFEKGVRIDPIYTSFDSLIQRARNSLFKIAVEQDYDYLFFIDSDVEWEPEWFYRILECPEDIVGAALVKKSDDNEGYTCKLLNKKLELNERKNLVKADGVGTGFLKFSRKAIHTLWDNSPEYKNEERMDDTPDRLVCNVEIKNGILISEDYILCNKAKQLGFDLWLDPTITINHMGPKKFRGDIDRFLRKAGYHV